MNCWKEHSIAGDGTKGISKVRQLGALDQKKEKKRQGTLGWDQHASSRGSECTGVIAELQDGCRKETQFIIMRALQTT